MLELIAELGTCLAGSLAQIHLTAVEAPASEACEVLKKRSHDRFAIWMLKIDQQENFHINYHFSQMYTSA